jgi:hypothetical protein
LDVQVSADGQGVLWTTGTVVHWQPLANCEPAGEEVLLDEWPGLQSLQFVPLGD